MPPSPTTAPLDTAQVAQNVPAQSLQDVSTLPALFAWRVRQSPAGEAYRIFDETLGQWRSIRWEQAAQQVAQYAAAMQSLDLPRGARVAILLPNGLAAVCADQATLALACVPVPMHALDNPASIAYILADSAAAVLFAPNVVVWHAIVATGIEMPALRTVVVLQQPDPTPPLAGCAPGCHVVELATWLSQVRTGDLAPLPAGPQADDLAALVYTSGTTGKPKGVMLTHGNVMRNILGVLTRVAPLPGDIFLSFLPLSHTFERTGGYYLPIAGGSCVAFSRSTALLAMDLKIIRPTILVSVPRIYERVYAATQAMLVDSPTKTWLFQWAQQVGWRRFCRAQGLPVVPDRWQWLDPLAWPLLRALVARPLLAQLGGRIRIAVSGGAALSAQVAHCFLGLGLPITQGYGMTETSPVVSLNTPEDNDPATVGRALPEVEVCLGENSELLVRGPSVMRGYWQREQDTAQTIVDGWLHTGDQARIAHGRIHILGRIKEIIVTSTGEKIAPVDLETAIAVDPLFDQVYVFGDDRPFIACIVVLAPAHWQALAKALGLDPQASSSLGDPRARKEALQRVRACTESFPYYAQPRAVSLTLEPWTVENSLMTPTLKRKRKNLAAHFAQDIGQIYARKT